MSFKIEHSTSTAPSEQFQIPDSSLPMHSILEKIDEIFKTCDKNLYQENATWENVVKEIRKTPQGYRSEVLDRTYNLMKKHKETMDTDPSIEMDSNGIYFQILKNQIIPKNHATSLQWNKCTDSHWDVLLAILQCCPQCDRDLLLNDISNKIRELEEYSLIDENSEGLSLILNRIEDTIEGLDHLQTTVSLGGTTAEGSSFDTFPTFIFTQEIMMTMEKLNRLKMNTNLISTLFSDKEFEELQNLCESALISLLDNKIPALSSRLKDGFDNLFYLFCNKIKEKIPKTIIIEEDVKSLLGNYFFPNYCSRTFNNNCFLDDLESIECAFKELLNSCNETIIYLNETVLSYIPKKTNTYNLNGFNANLRSLRTVIRQNSFGSVHAKTMFHTEQLLYISATIIPAIDSMELEWNMNSERDCLDKIQKVVQFIRPYKPLALKAGLPTLANNSSTRPSSQPESNPPQAVQKKKHVQFSTNPPEVKDIEYFPNELSEPPKLSRKSAKGIANMN